MSVVEIIKSSPFTLGVGGAEVVGLGSGGRHVQRELTHISWVNDLLKEGYSLNTPKSNGLNANEINKDQSTEGAQKFKSGACFENFFPEVEGIDDFSKVKFEEKSDDRVKLENDTSKKNQVVGCAIQRIDYKNYLTKMSSASNSKWGVLPAPLIYKSEVTLRNDKFGIALWTLWTGKLIIYASDDRFSRWEDNLEHRLFLLKNEGGKWEVTGKYDISFGKTMEFNIDNYIYKKIVVKNGEKEESWFDTNVRHDTKPTDHDNSKWLSHELVSFWESDKSSQSKTFKDVLVAGQQMISMFTGDTTSAQPQIKSARKQQKPKLFSKWRKPFRHIKGSWKNLDFCDRMIQTDGKKWSQKEINRAKNFCFKKTVQK